MKDVLVGGPFCRIAYEKINLNSSQAVKEYLLSKGWIPTTYNYRKDKSGYLVKDEDGNPIPTSPKLTEDSFDSVKGDIPKLVARRNILIHRQRMLKNTRKDGEEKGLLNAVREDGRVEARLIPQSTNTARATHSIVVNIPSIEATYGAEIRELFTVPEDSFLLGIDAQALEARCISHYLLGYKGGDEIADLLLHGDIHQENANLWNCSRKHAKSPFYALLFGSQIPKFSSTLGVDIITGARYFNAFWDRYKPLELFKDDLIKAWEARGGKKGGFLRGLDGRKLFARSQHSLVNLMIQSTGSIYVKTALAFIDKRITQYNIPAKRVIWMHDEAQIECKKGYENELKELCEKSFLDAGKYWKLRVPMTGEAKIGRDWKETH